MRTFSGCSDVTRRASGGAMLYVLCYVVLSYGVPEAQS